MVFVCHNSSAQTDTIQRDVIDIAHKIFHIKDPAIKDSLNRKVKISLVPFSSGTERRLSISSVNMAFYSGNPEVTNLSTVYFYPYTNLSGRYSFSMVSNLWSPGNKYNSTGDFEISSNTYEDYGLGSSSSADSAALIDYNHTRFHLQLSRKVFANFYLGLGYRFDYYYEVNQDAEIVPSVDFLNYQYGVTNITTSSGITFNLLRDNRTNSLNPEKGFYTNLSLQVYDPLFGSSYSWNAIYFDARKYFDFSEKNRDIFATRFLVWETFGDVPYLELPATFHDIEGRVGRGYYYSRFRGSGMLYAEAEYRFSISSNQLWGGVVFANAQSLREDLSGAYETVRPAAGVGVRLKFNKRSNANITFDVAVGKDSFNWHLNLGEFF